MVSERLTVRDWIRIRSDHSLAQAAQALVARHGWLSSQRTIPISLSHWFGVCTVAHGLFSLFLDLEHAWSYTRFDDILLGSPRCLDIGQGKAGSQRTLDVMARRRVQFLRP